MQRLHCLTIVTVVALATAPMAFGQGGVVIQVDQGLTDAVLAKAVTAEATGETVFDVIRKIGTAAGVKIQTDLKVQHILPGSMRMPIRQIRFTNVTLKAALEAVCVKFGLLYRVEPEMIWVEASPQLVALGRKATVHELVVLNRLRTRSLPVGGASMTLQQLLTIIETQLKVEYELSEDLAGVAANTPVQFAGGTTIAEALDQIAAKTDAEWSVPRGQVVLLTRAEMARRKVLSRLAAPANVQATAVPLYQVLTNLGRQAGVTVFFQPGSLLQLPAATRERFSLRMQGATVRQAFETVAGVTGLTYTVKADGVYFGMSAAAAQSSGADVLRAFRENPMVAFMRFQIGAMEMNVPIRKSDLPETVYLVLMQRKQQYIQLLGGQLVPAIAPPNILPPAGEGQ